MTEPSTERGPILAFAYELVAGDLVVDEWEGTEREVSAVKAGDREVTVTFADKSTEKSTQRPGSQTIYSVRRLRSLLPEEVAEPAPVGE